MIFMIMGHKKIEESRIYTKKKEQKSYGCTLLGLHTYLGLRIRPNVALCFILYKILHFFGNFGHVWPCVCEIVLFMKIGVARISTTVVES